MSNCGHAVTRALVPVCQEARRVSRLPQGYMDSTVFEYTVCDTHAVNFVAFGDATTTQRRMRHAVRLADDGTLVPCELATAVVHVHLRVGEVELVSPSLRPDAVCSSCDVHPFVLPPPWNQFLVPRDAHFIGVGGCSHDAAPLVATRVVELAAHSSRRKVGIGSDVAECAAYSVPDAAVVDGSEADEEEFDAEEEGLTDDDDEEWEDAEDQNVEIDVDDISLVADPKS